MSRVFLVLLSIGVSWSFINGPLIPTRPSRQQVALSFGLPSWIPNPQDDDDAQKGVQKKVDDDKPKIGLKGVIQLITAGAGSPFLGDYKGVDKVR